MTRAVLMVAPLMLCFPTSDASALTIVGFSRSGKHVLYRNADGQTQLYRRDGKKVDTPPDNLKVERYRFGKPARAKQLKLTKRRLQLRRKGQLITVWTQDVAESCSPTDIGEARFSRNRMVLAVVLNQDDCPQKRRALVISLATVSRRLALKGLTLARNGRRKRATLALKQAWTLRRSPQVLYSRARAAGLAGDSQGAVRLLRQLQAMRSAGARRLFVKAQFERDFRLVEGSKAFKDLFR